ncbi:MAG: lysophospholipid acyltransferase family protein [Acidobacteria bacterium]|nr:lysophospholipid acyltransferase family protein [Acidobacteriota bacterium]
MRYRFEYALAWLLLKLVGALPKSLARGMGITIAATVYLFHGKLRRVGMRNLALAFPEKSQRERRKILRRVFRSLGRQLGEVCLFPRYTRASIQKTVVYEGFENFERAAARGKGVVFLTGHLGAWELSAFAHSLYGYPLNIVMRPLDNPHLDRLVRAYRTMHGNKAVDKDFARGLIAALRKGETVGVLMDTNMIATQGVFVDFFGVDACTASGLARVALKTDAAVVPGFTIWDPQLKKYRLRFDPAVQLMRSENPEADVLENTAIFTKIIEDYVRRYPDQWLWVHRRWKTRPQGEPPLYGEGRHGS